MSHLYEGRGVRGYAFNVIRKDRILERLTFSESRRQQDLHRIREMKCKSGIGPLDQYPYDLWEKVFHQLGSKDLGNTWDVHPHFQEILKDRRIRDILFPQVLNLEFHPFWEVPEADPELRQHEQQRRHEQNGEPLALATFTELRKVSKSLRNVIDLWHEDNIIRNMRSQDESQVPSVSLKFPQSDEDTFKLDGMLANFGGDCGGRSARRFFLRSLKVQLVGSSQEAKSLRETFMEFKSKVMGLMEKMGDQIRRFEFVIEELDRMSASEGQDVPVSEIYNTLIEWMALVPNLKWLVLRNEVETGESKIPVRMYHTTPFPYLEHLERVCCSLDTMNNGNIFHILKSVLKANPHVKAINLRPGIERRNGLFFNARFQPLMRMLPLELDMFSLNSSELDLNSNSCHLYQIEPAIQLKWPLKRLCLRGISQIITDLSSIFSLLAKFQTLEHLTLNLSNPVSFGCQIPFLRLPKLTHFKLEVKYDSYRDENMKGIARGNARNFFFSLQFLLYVKKLEKLTWTLEALEYDMQKLERFLASREDNCIDFRAGLRDMRSCNLWQFFPYLETVEVDVKKLRGERQVTICRRGETCNQNLEFKAPEGFGWVEDSAK